jgi:hypothetical protein
MPTLLSDVRCWGQSGKHLLAASISLFDPTRTSTFLATYQVNISDLWFASRG